METKKSNNFGILFIGGMIGAILGTIAAIILIKSAEQAKDKPHINTQNGFQLGLGVISLLRSFAKMSDLKK